MRWKILIVVIAALGAFGWLRHVRTQAAPAGPKTDLTWMTDADAARAVARAENKTLLLDFTGSDWCGWCIRLDNEVFSTPEFASYAREKLVLLKLDFPKRREQSAAERKQNEELAAQYGIRGFPTIVVLRPDGTEKGRLGYSPGGPKVWLGELESLR